MADSCPSLPPLGPLLFGNKSDEFQELFFKDKRTQKDALMVLDAIVHPEINNMIDFLKFQMKSYTSDILEYSSGTYSYYGSFYLKAIENPETLNYNKILMFTDAAHQYGFDKKIFTLLREAFPEYDVPEEQKAGILQMIKKISLSDS